MSAVNRTFWQDAANVPAVIREGPIPSKVDDGELLIRAHAWAMNPVNAFIQTTALPIFKYPTILGEDVSGVVELVGSGPSSSKFKPGDRVVGLALGATSGYGKDDQGGFQNYVVLDAGLACKIPDALSFAEAAVFPLCVATAAHALFSSDYLGLPFPRATVPTTSPSAASDKKKTLFVWGGASAVGCNAIQLAVAAGLAVVTTCSPRNFALVESLGAAKAFDYNAPTVVDDVVAELDARGECVGVFQAAGPVGGIEPSCAVAHRLRAQQKPLVACANHVPEGAAPEGVTAKFVFSQSEEELAVYRRTMAVIFGEFLPEALANGSYKVAPKPEVVNRKGLDGIQEALDILRKGVSAKKIVVVAE
ncbi:GroES-like protein [Hypoxylon rubiginosum]|uniref:GroES-like protein n=1 Tax=Hypoxylon rubiginosum TaxID=110542 RepID=A0ACC0CPK0_9PEZI|nr:GroES-like protein [Hypoxylon rubiginosum]